MAEGIVFHLCLVVFPTGRFVLILSPTFLEGIHLARVVCLDAKRNCLCSKTNVGCKRGIDPCLLLSEVFARSNSTTSMTPILLTNIVRMGYRSVTSTLVHTPLPRKVFVSKGRPPFTAAALSQGVAFRSLCVVGLEWTFADAKTSGVEHHGISRGRGRRIVAPRKPCKELMRSALRGARAGPVKSLELVLKTTGPIANARSSTSSR
mmetsp:Transcript_22765/g.49432  ORF Transcript_22765/g.49432 Transcript_22765/m.49432 type:complete len:206 (-) Transcript_22765:118-735(-)